MGVHGHGKEIRISPGCRIDRFPPRLYLGLDTSCFSVVCSRRKIGGSQTLLIESREIEKGRLVRKVSCLKKSVCRPSPIRGRLFF
jgi:hypothetical protein